MFHSTGTDQAIPRSFMVVRYRHITSHSSWLSLWPGQSQPTGFRHSPFVWRVWHFLQRWFLYPPDEQPEFHPNHTTLTWVKKSYPVLGINERPLECTIRPGEVRTDALLTLQTPIHKVQAKYMWHCNYINLPFMYLYCLIELHHMYVEANSKLVFCVSFWCASVGALFPWPLVACNTESGHQRFHFYIPWLTPPPSKIGPY